MSKEKLIDLDREQLDLLHAILKRHIPNKTVWAYGSRATWKAKETSDLDLAVFDCSPMEIFHLKEELEESDLLVSVDVMDWESIPESFREHIREKYVVVQEQTTRPEGWRELKLDELGEVITGKTPSEKNPEDWGNEMSFVTPSDYKNYGKFAYSGGRKLSNEGISKLRNKVLPSKSVMVTCIGSDMGKVAMTKFQVITNQQINSIVPNPKVVEPDFLYYFLVSIYNLLRVYGTEGTAVPILNKSDFGRIKIHLPPLFEQKAIAEVLSSLDDKIDLLQRQNKTLEAMAQALFRKLFTGPESRQSDTGTLPDEFTVTMGQSPPGTSYNEEKEGTPLFQGNADFGFRFPKNRVYTTEPKRFAEKFDTLVSVRAPVGEQNMAQENCCIGRGVASFRYKKNQEFYSYTYYKMKSLMKEIKRFDQEGTVFGSISKDDFEKFEIVLPPHNLIQAFNKNVREIDEKICLNHSQIHKLENLRDTLLPKLMSGSVSLKAG